FNGHDFLLEAKDKGASAYIVNKEISHDFINKHNLQNVIIVDDTVTALQRIASAYLKTLKSKTIMITGSCGKTSVKDLLFHVLKTKYTVLKTEKNLNNYLGLPLTILGLTGREDYCILEAGINSFGELDYLSSLIKPDLAVITNIGKAHLEAFKDINGVIKAKWEITNHIKEKGSLIINGDDPLLREKLNEKKLKFNIITFGINNNNNFFVNSHEMKNFSQTAVIGSSKYSSTWTLNTSIAGKSGLYNNLAVISLCDCLDIHPEYTIKQLNQEIPLTCMRFEQNNINNITIINDAYNANPTSMQEGLQNISNVLLNGKKILILGDMLELGGVSEQEHKNIGLFLRSIDFDVLICYGDLSRFIYDEVIKGNFDKNSIFWYNNKDKVIDLLKSISVKGDLLYFKASRAVHLEDIVQEISKFIKNI
ncbi:UDP-N-acetylmuramoyl-tripeptide--D-alanyl-D-alanine ligase, partial [bacterium]